MRVGVWQLQFSVWYASQIADLPVEEYEALWSEYVSAYAEHLLKADNDPSSPAGKRLVRAPNSHSVWSEYHPAGHQVSLHCILCWPCNQSQSQGLVVVKRLLLGTYAPD